MKVFISWSGPRSRVVAEALRSWLPKVIQNVKPWTSSMDIEAGARWNAKIAAELSQTSFGILCVTPESVDAPWLAFEAGAIAKAIDESHVCPYLIGMEPSDILPGPILQFQAKRANEKETLELLSSINAAMGGDALPSAQLEETFSVWWPRLKERLDKLPKSDDASVKPRKTDEMVKEILDVVRGLARDAEVRVPVEVSGGLQGWVSTISDQLNRRPDILKMASRGSRALNVLRMRAHNAVTSDPELHGRTIEVNDIAVNSPKVIELVFSIDGRTVGAFLSMDPEAALIERGPFEIAVRSLVKDLSQKLDETK